MVGNSGPAEAVPGSGARSATRALWKASTRSAADEEEDFPHSLAPRARQLEAPGRGVEGESATVLILRPVIRSCSPRAAERPGHVAGVAVCTRPDAGTGARAEILFGGGIPSQELPHPQFSHALARGPSADGGLRRSAKDAPTSISRASPPSSSATACTCASFGTRTSVLASTAVRNDATLRIEFDLTNTERAQAPKSPDLLKPPRGQASLCAFRRALEGGATEHVSIELAIPSPLTTT